MSKKIVGIIAAGGLGTRLRPMTLVTNKHLVGIYDSPMIYYPIKKLKQAGIEDILIVTGPEFSGHFINLLGNGEKLGVNLSYRFQSEADGIAGAIKLGKSFVNNNPFVVLLGDNVFEFNISKYVRQYEKNHSKAKIFLKIVDDPSMFGVAKLEDGHIVDIIEKPKTFISNYAVTGLYFYNPSIFSIIDNLQKSPRGEFEVTDINSYYIKNGLMDYEIIDNFWQDCGTPESLFKASEFVKNNQDKFI